MNSYRPEFYTSCRGGKTAVWVRMPDGLRCNIWDLPSEQFTREMRKAIESAFRRGAQAMKQEMRRTLDAEMLSGMTTEDAWGPKRGSDEG